MINKYIWAECPVDTWPWIRNISAKSYNDAVEKIIMQYSNELDDDFISDTIENWKQLREYLNDHYTIALSDLEIYEEI
jgi:hypothetical protein